MKEARILNNLVIKRTNIVDQAIYLKHIKHCNLIPRTICLATRALLPWEKKSFYVVCDKSEWVRRNRDLNHMAVESVDSKGRRTLVDVLSTSHASQPIRKCRTVTPVEKEPSWFWMTRPQASASVRQADSLTTFNPILTSTKNLQFYNKKIA